MDEIEELTDLLARHAVENTDDVEAVVHPQHLVAKLTAAGEIDIAAKVANAFRQHGRTVNTAKEVEARAKRLRAERGAENFRRINKANATQHPLPAWIRSEIGEIY